MCNFLSLQLLCQTFLASLNIYTDQIRAETHVGRQIKCALCVSGLKTNFKSPTNFSKTTQHKGSWKFCQLFWVIICGRFFIDWLKATRFFENPRTAYQSTQRHIPEDSSPCERTDSWTILSFLCTNSFKPGGLNTLTAANCIFPSWHSRHVQPLDGHLAHSSRVVFIPQENLRNALSLSNLKVKLV
jgi:hypothetical protein